MPHELTNDALRLAVNDDGTGLTIADLRRGVIWQLDERHLGCVSSLENGQRIAMRAAAVRGDGDALVVERTVPGGVARYVWRLLTDGLEVALTLTSNEVVSVPLPGSFVPEGEKPTVLVPLHQGMLFRGDGEDWEESAHRCQMNMAAWRGTRGALLAAVESIPNTKAATRIYCYSYSHSVVPEADDKTWETASTRWRISVRVPWWRIARSPTHELGGNALWSGMGSVGDD